VNFTDNAENAIVLNDEEADVFFENTDLLNLCKRLYVGHDVLLTAEQEETLKSLAIELIVIPDYYYKGLEVNQ
jgi:adenine-specific DNA-methyltransferase